MRQSVAEQLREKLRSERLRREAIERLQRQFDVGSAVVEAALKDFVETLLASFNGGGEVRRLPDPRDRRSRSWQVLGFRSPGHNEQREPVITVLLTMRGVDALDRGQPALECRVSTPRNPRLVDFTAGDRVPPRSRRRHLPGLPGYPRDAPLRAVVDVGRRRLAVDGGALTRRIAGRDDEVLSEVRRPAGAQGAIGGRERPHCQAEAAASSSSATSPSAAGEWSSGTEKRC